MADVLGELAPVTTPRETAEPGGPGALVGPVDGATHQLDVEPSGAVGPPTAVAWDGAGLLPEPAAPLESEVAPFAPVLPPRVGLPSRRQRKAAQRLQARKVGRLVRHVDLWSLTKVALLFYLVALVVVVIAGTIVWSLLQRSGTIPDAESFIREAFALESFRFDGPLLFRLAVLGGLLGVVAATLLTVLLGLVFNVIADLTGGLRVAVVQEETTRPLRARPTRQVPAGGGEP